MTIPDDFAARAAAHWTPERLAKLVHGKRWPITPAAAPVLLRVIGLLNADATLSADSVRKLSQVNHLLSLLRPSLDDLAERHRVVRVLDAACGTSFVALIAAWYLARSKQHTVEVLGIDRDPRVIGTSRQRAAELGCGDHVRFSARPLEPLAWREGYREAFAGEGDVPRPHLVLALHACDTATDDALALAIGARADVIAVAPCCQAELARAWADRPLDDHPLGPLFHTPNLRRDAAATATDALRLLLTRASGYEVTATEFVPSAHTPKNRLLLATRRGQHLASALAEFDALKRALGGPTLQLEALLEGIGKLRRGDPPRDMAS